MAVGRTRAAPRLRGIYYLEVLEAIRFFLTVEAARAGARTGGRDCRTHSFLSTSDNLYCQILADGIEANAPAVALNFLQARDFYEELFAPDDLPNVMKPVLLEIIHKYILLAEGLPPEEVPAFRPAYRIVLGLPFLPQDANSFCIWMAHNLSLAKA